MEHLDQAFGNRSRGKQISTHLQILSASLIVSFDFLSRSKETVTEKDSFRKSPNLSLRIGRGGGLSSVIYDYGIGRQ